jgi:hypothetical protein
VQKLIFPSPHCLFLRAGFSAFGLPPFRLKRHARWQIQIFVPPAGGVLSSLGPMTWFSISKICTTTHKPLLAKTISDILHLLTEPLTTRAIHLKLILNSCDQLVHGLVWTPCRLTCKPRTDAFPAPHSGKRVARILIFSPLHKQVAGRQVAHQVQILSERLEPDRPAFKRMTTGAIDAGPGCG